MATQLDHPSIRKIVRCIKKGSLFRTTDLYLVMELVDGRSLDLSPPRTMAQAVHIFEQTARAARTCTRGLGSRGHEPNNIVVDGETHAKIIDLGQSCKVGTIKQRIRGRPTTSPRSSASAGDHAQDRHLQPRGDDVLGAVPPAHPHGACPRTIGSSARSTTA